MKLCAKKPAQFLFKQKIKSNQSQNRFLFFVLSDFLRQLFWHNFY
jgi:hypothetical protein